MARAKTGESLDLLLAGRVRLRQPARGYRVAIDAVLLAAAVRASPRHRVLDVGTGVGAAALCLARFCPGCRIVGLEPERRAVRLARANVASNGLVQRIEIVEGRIEAPPPALARASFDHVMMNPPYLEPARMRAPRNKARAQAMMEEQGLAAWIGFALSMLRPRGTLTVIHRADRLDELLSLLRGPMGGLTVFPLWPGGGKPAKRVLVRARKGSKTALLLLPGLVLHEPDGRFTAAAEAVLREGKPLRF